MKTTNYRLQTQLEHLGPLTQEKYFKEYFKEVLESDKPYYTKSDYIALSFMELENKVLYLSNEIKTFTTLKKRLTEAKQRGLEIAAELLKEYGIDKMEGTAISSLTIAPQKTKLKSDIQIKDPDKVMELGYINYTVDMKAVEKAMQSIDRFSELDPFVEVSITEEIVPPRLKINKRCSVSNTAGDTVEILEASRPQEVA